MDLVCETLTEDLDDGENSIPFWMFEVCYKFLANLDCGSDQQVESDPTYVSITITQHLKRFTTENLFFIA